jgi:DNA replication protein DnaC
MSDDNIRQFDANRPRRATGFTRIGDVTGAITRNPDALARIPMRVVDDPERSPYIPSGPLPGETWKCPQCKFTVDVEYNHGWFRGPDGREVPCPMCSKAVIHARNRRKADANIRTLVHEGNFLDMQNLPVEAWIYSLADYPGDPAYVEEVQRFISGDTKELMLFGEPGVGKTGLAISAVHELFRLRQQVLHITMEQYLDLLKENFASGAQNNNVKSIVSSVRYLVVDDVGAGLETSLAMKEIQFLVDIRHAHGLSTLITSNMDVEGLGAFWHMDKYNRTGFQPASRVVSRLRGWYRVVEVKGADLRMGDDL